MKKLAKLREEFECVGDVRGKGLMIGVELVTDKETRTPLPRNQSVYIREECKNLGVLLGGGGLNGNVSIECNIYCPNRSISMKCVLAFGFFRNHG